MPSTSNKITTTKVQSTSNSPTAIGQNVLKITEIQDNKINKETLKNFTIKKEHQETKDTTEAKTSKEEDKHPKEKEVNPSNVVN